MNRAFVCPIVPGRLPMSRSFLVQPNSDGNDRHVRPNVTIWKQPGARYSAIYGCVDTLTTSP